MSAYVDSSALVKLYVDEDRSEEARTLLRVAAPWVTARHTFVEVGRVLGRVLEGRWLEEADHRFRAHWQTASIVEINQQICASAVMLARHSRVRTLDALHLAAAQRAGGGALPFVTYDLRQADAARSLGWEVLGA